MGRDQETKGPGDQKTRGLGQPYPRQEPTLGKKTWGPFRPEQDTQPTRQRRKQSVDKTPGDPPEPGQAPSGGPSRRTSVDSFTGLWLMHRRHRRTGRQLRRDRGLSLLLDGCTAKKQVYRQRVLVERSVGRFGQMESSNAQVGFREGNSDKYAGTDGQIDRQDAAVGKRSGLKDWMSTKGALYNDVIE